MTNRLASSICAPEGIGRPATPLAFSDEPCPPDALDWLRLRCCCCCCCSAHCWVASACGFGGTLPVELDRRAALGPPDGLKDGLPRSASTIRLTSGGRFMATRWAVVKPASRSIT